MSPDKPKKKTSSHSSSLTRVDLGDDLISSRKNPPKENAKPSRNAEAAAPSGDIGDQLQSAKILVSEGFSEDAKKLLRKILIADPDHTGAKEALQEILDRDLKELLSDSDSPVNRPRIFERGGKDERGTQSSAEESLSELERELGLEDLQSVEGGDETSMTIQSPDPSQSDCMDLGVALFEMGLFEQAIEQFQKAIEKAEMSDEEGSILQVMSATALLARAYIRADRAHDAIRVMQLVLRETETSEKEKLEFFYLMGSAYDRLGKRKTAINWYGRVKELDPHYRDIRDKLRKPVS